MTYEPKPAELLDAQHDDPDLTGPLTDYEPEPATAASERDKRRCPYCWQCVAVVTVSNQLILAVHSRFVVDELRDCKGSGTEAVNV